MKPRLFALCILALCLFPGVVGATGSLRLAETSVTAPAAPFTVNSSADDANAHDWLPGDGNCADSLGRCTLRAAIEETNDLTGADTITFDSGRYIYLDTSEGALPQITEQLRIDASSVWNGTNDWPGVTVNGIDQSVPGLVLYADNCEVYGLFLINFTNAIDIRSASNTIGGTLPGWRNVLSSNYDQGVFIYGSGAHDNVVQGNWIGLSITGDTKGSNYIGVAIQDGAHDNTIGGSTAAQGNYISGNTAYGVYIQGTFATNSNGNRLGGNVIGLPVVGSQDVGNGLEGVVVTDWSKNTVIGASLAPNTISSNGNSGIRVSYGSDYTTIQDNTINGNGLEGVYIYESGHNQVLGNTIAYNDSDGVRVTGGVSAVSNPILSNSIHHNGGKGIALISGGNNGLAAPTITAASGSGASGTGCASCQIQVFSDGADQGQIHHGSVTANAIGNWSYSGAITGPNVTATNTDSANNTSEFSTPKALYFLYLPLIVKNN